jgi:hypothetical protein
MAILGKPAGPLRPGDILTPSPLYRFIPLGVLSLASYGLIFIGLAAIVLGLLKDPDLVLSSFDAEGLKVWAICILAAFALLALNLGLGTLMSRRRIVIEAGHIIVRNALGGEKRVSAREVTDILTVYSMAALMQGTIRLKYRDGSRASLDGAGFDSNDLSRVTAYISKLK